MTDQKNSESNTSIKPIRQEYYQCLPCKHRETCEYVNTDKLWNSDDVCLQYEYAEVKSHYPAHVI
jgi:hypothetical protein